MTLLSSKTHRSVVILVIVSFGSAVLAQKPVPEQQPGGYRDDEIIRISTDLAQIDFTVLDKQGRFVEGLRSDQFQLLVDGKPQTILFFEQLKTGTEREGQLARAGQSPGAQKLTAEGVSPLIPSTVDRGRTVFLFADDLHLSAASIKRTRDLLLNYVDNIMGPMDQAVIATASGQLGFLQQLTGDRAVLRRAIERLTYRPSTAADTLTLPAMNEYQAVAIENGDRDALSYFVDKQCDEFKRMGRGTCAVDTGMTNNAVYDDAVARSGRGGGSISGTSPGPVTVEPGQTGRGRTGGGGNTLRPEADRLVRSRARIVARQSAQVALNTLGSLESLIRSASSLPERKLVVFISDGFFINYLRSTNTYDLRRVADAASRSGSVIYTIDARALVTGSPEASTNDGFDPQGRSARLTINEATAAQDPLHTLAADTGGRAWVNSNDLAAGIGQALQETSSYYLLAWRPENVGEGKPRFSAIEVKLKDRPDLSIRSHAGFFHSGVKNDSVASNNTTPAKPKTMEDQLLDIIRAPYPPRTLPTGLSVGYLSLANGAMAVAATLMVDAGALSDPKASEVDVMGVVTNEKGDVLSSVTERLTAAATQRGRTIYTMQFPNLPAGLYQVRLAARDPRTGVAGGSSQWLEIPDASKGDFLVSSIFLSEVAVNAGAANAQKVTINPDRRFARTSRMRVQAQIFNAARGASSPDLTLELQLSKAGQVMIATPPTAVSTQGITDLTRVPLTAEFPLEVVGPGRYTLKITIMDRVAKKSAAQQVEFTVE